MGNTEFPTPEKRNEGSEVSEVGDSISLDLVDRVIGIPQDEARLSGMIKERSYGLKPIITPIKKMGKYRLNFSSGTRIFPSFVNTDKFALEGIQLLMDFEDPIWTEVPDDIFDYLYFGDVLEHVPHRSEKVEGELFVALVNELLRISRPGALWEVCSPHWQNKSAFDSPGHCRVVNEGAFWPWRIDVNPRSGEMQTLVKGERKGLKLLRGRTTRQFQLGRLSDYHVRKYLKLGIGKVSKHITTWEVIIL